MQRLIMLNTPPVTYRRHLAPPSPTLCNRDNVCVYMRACVSVCVSHGRWVGPQMLLPPPASGCLVFHSSAQTEEPYSASQPARRAHTSSQRWLQSPAAGDDDDAGQFKACNIAPLSPARSAGYAISSALFFIFLLHSLPSCCICGVT